MTALRRQPGVSRTVPIDELIAADEALLEADVHVSGEVRGGVENGRLSVIGIVTAETTVPCSCCLSMFLLRVPVAFDEVFDFQAAPATSGELAAQHFVGTVTGEALDVADLAREHVLLAFPDQPLCREDCAGLCPVCGTNRNESPCRCTIGDDDGRLAKLKCIRIQP